MAAITCAGLVSANSSVSNSLPEKKIETQKLIKQTKYFLGTCVVTIYRENADGSTTVVKTDVSLQPSAEACNTHAQIVLMDAQQQGL